MNPGKLSNQILNRSVFKNISKNASTVKPGIGFDCGVMKSEYGVTYATTNISIDGVAHCENAIVKAHNNLCVKGAKPIGCMVSILYNRDFNEPTLKNIMKRLDKAAISYGMPISGGDTRIVAGLKSPVISVTGIGTADVVTTPVKLSGEYDIVVSKDIAIEGINIIADMKQEEILKKYSTIFFEDVGYEQEALSIATEAKLVREYDSYIHDVSEGGIFSAIWDMCEAYHTGCRIDLKKLPVKQSTIEVCEMFDVNPYYLLSGGTAVIMTKHSEDLIARLEDCGIRACVVGTTTDNNDKIITSGEEIRYLDTPQKDEIYKFL